LRDRFVTQPRCLQGKDWPIDPEPARQGTVTEHRSADRMHAVERRLRAIAPERHEGWSLGPADVEPEAVRHGRDRAAAEQDRERQPPAELALDARHETRREQGVPAEVEERLVRSDR